MAALPLDTFQKMDLSEKKQEDWIVSLVVSMVTLILKANEENSPTSVDCLVMKTKNNNLINKDLPLKMTKTLFKKTQSTQQIDSGNHKLFNLPIMKFQTLQDVNHKEDLHKDLHNVVHNQPTNSLTSKQNNSPLDNKDHEQDQLLLLQDQPKEEVLYKTCSVLPMVHQLHNLHQPLLSPDHAQPQQELAQQPTQDQTSISILK